MQISNIITVVIPSVLVISSGIVQLIVQMRELKKVKQELQGTKAIIKDTSDLKAALTHGIEGKWLVSGQFLPFQGDSAIHKSSGYLVLNWNPILKHYDAIYTYSVYKEYTADPVVITICTGASIKDVENDAITFRMNIQHRRSDTKAAFQKAFSLEMTVKSKEDSGMIKELRTEYKTPNTEGAISFVRTI